MFAIDHFNTLKEVIAAINAANNGAVPYFGGTYTGSAENLAAEYAIRALEGDQEEWLQEIEAHLDFLREVGAFFSFEEAGEIARKKIIQMLLDKARQELGEDATMAQVVARAAGDDGTRFAVVEGGNFLHTIWVRDLIDALGAKYEYTIRDQHSVSRYIFDDESVIVVSVKVWGFEGNEPFSVAEK